MAFSLIDLSSFISIYFFIPSMLCMELFLCVSRLYELNELRGEVNSVISSGIIKIIFRNLAPAISLSLYDSFVGTCVVFLASVSTISYLILQNETLPRLCTAV